MNKTFWNMSLSLAACAAICGSSFAAPPTTAQPAKARPIAAHRYTNSDRKEQKQSVTLAIGGAEDNQSAQLLTKALQEQGLHATIPDRRY